MEPKFWLERWEHGQTPFHQPEGHPLLPECWPTLRLAAGASVLVPLSGKSRDMLWLARRGHAVTGIELSAHAARDFFAEAGMTPAIQDDGRFTHYAAGNVTIRVGNLFDLDTATIAGFDAFYDRAALIALPPAMRSAYVEHLVATLAPGTRGLLITLDYDPSEMNGPPFAVTDAEMERLFASHADIECLAEREALGGEDDHLRKRGLTTARERVYRLTRR
jgi:thiopurine S-methyltransferase